MKAVVLHAPERLAVGDWPTPVPGPRDVVIAPKAAGICAGDLYLYGGRNPYATYPFIGGHEVGGIVVETGSEVSRVKNGNSQSTA